MEQLSLRRPDDWHLHLRDNETLRSVVGYSADHFGRALVMPNLVPPVVTLADAESYRQRIVECLPDGARFTPLMTLYLTEETDPNDVSAAKDAGVITAVKLYPAGATTNSQSGVRNINSVMPVLERMADIDLPLCVHGEVTDTEVDIFDREARFIDQILDPLRRRLPELRVVLEHVTTKDGVDFVQNADRGIAATITPHHLIINRNHILVGGIRPHYYCLPIAKRESHRQALRHAATSGDRRFFLGTDSAPHFDRDKESDCGCAGVFNTVNAMACLAQVFEHDNALEQLEAFTSLNGAKFYGIKPNEDYITLLRKPDAVDYSKKVAVDDDQITVFDPGFEIYWQVE